MPEHTSRRALASAALLSAGLVAVSLALFDPFFTNDGAVMAMIASGTGVALRPDEHLVFTNVLVGRVVSGLYERAPDVPWYGLHLVGVQAVAWTGLFHACLSRGVAPARLARCAVAYGVIGLAVLVNLQFSSTAFLAALAGGCLWLNAATDAPRGWPVAASAVLLMVLGSLERLDPFLLVLPLAGLAGLVLARGRPSRQWWAIGAASALLAAGAFAYDRHAYRQDAGWRAFREFIPLLPEITDYGRASAAEAELTPALERAGWSENDHRLFMQWFHADAQVYSADALRRLMREVPQSGPLERIGSGVTRLERVTANPALWAMLLCLPWLLLGAGRRVQAVVGALLVAALALTLLLAAFRKSAPQVYLPLFAFPLCFALAGNAGAAGARRREALLIALAAGGVALSIAHQHREGRNERRQAGILLDRYAPLIGAPQQLVVAWFNAFPFEVVRPLEPPSRLRSLRLLSLGWSQRTPLAQDLLASFGSADLVDALADPRTVLLAPSAAPPLLALFAEEHRALRLRFTPERTEPFATFRGHVADR
jgi:hypothetical protein